MDLFILGIITGICIAYLFMRCKIVYKNNCLIVKNIDKESKDNLEKFINECIRKDKLEQIKEK